MKNLKMQLKRAECPAKVAEIVAKTIKAVYPRYYPSGAVQFFLDLHNEQQIKEALSREDIYFAVVEALLSYDGKVVRQIRILFYRIFLLTKNFWYFKISICS